MILDAFRVQTAVFQVTYPEAFLVWDQAGKIATQICQIWPGMELSEGRPNIQKLVSKYVTIETGLKSSTISLLGSAALDSGNVRMMQDTFEVWRNLLDLSDVNRISTVITYSRDFESIKEANEMLLSLGIARSPNGKVFDQPTDSELNSIDLLYRFEDENSFTTLRLRSEKSEYHVRLNPKYIDDDEIMETKCQVLLSFDRGLLGSVNCSKFRLEDWIKGLLHLLRRDIEKVIPS